MISLDNNDSGQNQHFNDGIKSPDLNYASRLPTANEEKDHENTQEFNKAGDYFKNIVDVNDNRSQRQ